MVADRRRRRSCGDGVGIGGGCCCVDDCCSHSDIRKRLDLMSSSEQMTWRVSSSMVGLASLILFFRIRIVFRRRFCCRVRVGVDIDVSGVSMFEGSGNRGTVVIAFD